MIRRTINSFPPAGEQLGLQFDKHPKAATAPVVPMLDPLTVRIAEAVRMASLRALVGQANR